MSRYSYLGTLICVAIVTIGGSRAHGAIDLQIYSYGVTMAKDYNTGNTTVTAVVWNTGGTNCTAIFKVLLKVWVGSTSSATTKFVSGLVAGGVTTETAVFSGTNWTCASGKADSGLTVTESNENNNYDNVNNVWIEIAPWETWDDDISIVCPGSVGGEVSLTPIEPPGWTVTVDPGPYVVYPGECVVVGVSFEAPDYTGHEEIVVNGEFTEFGRGSIALMDWTYHVFSPISNDTVVCEPQGASPHPPTYWYDVTPGAFGRCDFHVLVFDPNPGNYTNPSLPFGTWQFAVHQVGNDWWASWWDPGCVNAIFGLFRFQFTNPNQSTWGEWTTTIDGTWNPYAQVIDVSAAHAGEPDGYGYRVHVPAHFEEAGPIPTVSEWGLIVMTLLLLTVGTVVFGRRRRPAAA